ncbi:MAG: SLAP domain-containing protein [Clostridia bacterium]|nr:SLAP domain-containing protein [Clostridia bacterium]
MAFASCGCSKAVPKNLHAVNNIHRVENEAWKIDESRGHYVDEYASPTMTGTQLDAALTEAYFTQNGHLCLDLLISNGTDKMMQINALDIQAFDYATGEQFAGGAVTLEELMIEAAGIEPYTVYIAPDHVLKGEDYKLPELVSLTISFDSEPVEVA